MDIPDADASLPTAGLYKRTVFLQAQTLPGPTFIKPSHLPFEPKHHMSDIEPQQANHPPGDTFSRSSLHQQHNHGSHGAQVGLHYRDILP